MFAGINLGSTPSSALVRAWISISVWPRVTQAISADSYQDDCENNDEYPYHGVVVQRILTLLHADSNFIPFKNLVLNRSIRSKHSKCWPHLFTCFAKILILLRLSYRAPLTRTFRITSTIISINFPAKTHVRGWTIPKGATVHGTIGVGLALLSTVHETTALLVSRRTAPAQAFKAVIAEVIYEFGPLVASAPGNTLAPRTAPRRLLALFVEPTRHT